MDLAQALNAPEVVDLGGRSFPVRQLRLSEWAELQSWLKRAVPSPVTQALRSLQESEDFGIAVSDRVRKELLDHAQEAAKKWPPAVGTRSWVRAVESAEGGASHFVRTVIEKSGTPISLPEVHDLLEKASEAELHELLRVCYYGDPPSPKAETPATSPAATVTTPSTTTIPATTGPNPSMP